MSEMMKSDVEAMQANTARRGFWKHENGEVWWNDAPYVRPDGVTPKFSPSLHISVMESHFDAGTLDTVEWLLDGKDTASIEALGDTNWQSRISSLRLRLRETRNSTALR